MVALLTNQYMHILNYNYYYILIHIYIYLYMYCYTALRCDASH